MGMRAPKRSMGGFHSPDQRKPNPKRWSDGQAPTTREATVPPRIRRTMAAKKRVRLKKTQSPIPLCRGLLIVSVRLVKAQLYRKAGPRPPDGNAARYSYIGIYMI